MNTTEIRQNVLFPLVTTLVAMGLICLTFHEFINIEEVDLFADQSPSSNKKIPIPDDCYLCIVSTYSFTEPDHVVAVPVYTDYGSLLPFSFAIPKGQLFSTVAQRAPPITS